jgi:hypothetical protein
LKAACSWGIWAVWVWAILAPLLLFHTFREVRDLKRAVASSERKRIQVMQNLVAIREYFGIPDPTKKAKR